MLSEVKPPGHDMEFVTVYPADPGFEEPDYNEFDGVAWTGSSLSLTKETDPAVVTQIRMAENIAKTEVPQYGSCWGLQMAGRVFGKAVQPCKPGREMGIGRRMLLSEEGK